MRPEAIIIRLEVQPPDEGVRARYDSQQGHLVESHFPSLWDDLWKHLFGTSGVCLSEHSGWRGYPFLAAFFFLDPAVWTNRCLVLSLIRVHVCLSLVWL